MQTRRASIKETGEELTAAEWERFDAAVAKLKAERGEKDCVENGGHVDAPSGSPKPTQP